MTPIKKLSPEVIQKIAAGEVVERPASVVKELVENALDASATEIVVDVLQGGRKRVQVFDNGCGMSRDDMLLSVERHTTSKISVSDDLFALHTYGFRGEALSSIAEVSLFSIQTRSREAVSGICYTKTYDGWVETEVPMPTGTKITVDHLFYNVPARQKFLKTAFTEYTHILHILTNFALIKPLVSFRFTHNGQLVFSYDAKQHWHERIADVLTETLTLHLRPLQYKEDTVVVDGFVSVYTSVLDSRKHQYCFVNERPVRDALISKALHAGYEGLIQKLKYPMAVIRLTLPPHLVDVNVHPRKTEVRFANTNLVYNAVLQGVKACMDGQRQRISVPEGAREIVSHLENKGSGELEKAMWNKKVVSSDVVPAHEFFQKRLSVADVHRSIQLHTQLFAKPTDALLQELQEKKAVWKPIGQIEKKYIVASSDTSLIIVDQHAAAEGILYHQWQEQGVGGRLSSQKLLLPVIISLPRSLFDTILYENVFLEEFGFLIRSFGESDIVVEAIPSDLVSCDVKELIFVLADDLLASEGATREGVLRSKKHRLLQSMACKGAVRFEDTLLHEEQERLLRDLQSFSILTCAHGRPAFWEVSFHDLNKKFQRC